MRVLAAPPSPRQQESKHEQKDRTRVKSGFQSCCLECKVSQTSTYYPSIEAALEAWNTRTHPASQPLTDEQIEPLFKARQNESAIGIKDDWYWYAWGVSDGERAHGIGGEEA